MAGIYIHIPFCKSRCSYCDFFSTTMLNRRDDYVKALKTEILDHSDQLSRTDIESIYFGGGTPSLLSPSQLQQVFDVLPVTSAKEITLECNPGDITLENLTLWRKMGFNRLSIGVQSFNDTILKTIGRRHNAAQARLAVKQAQMAGFNNISIDIIYAIPTPPEISYSPIEITKQDIESALQLHIQHISTYCLTFEEGTPIYTLLQQGKLKEVEDDIENQIYDYIAKKLQDAGFEHYEVSNFAISNRHSLHNSNYWNNTPYFGFGAGAHAYDGNSRSWNPANLDQYIRQTLTHSLQREYEHLTPIDKYNEYVMLGLRTATGVELGKINNKQVVESYLDRGLLRLTNTEDPHIVATLEGIHILNQIIEDLME